MLDLFHSVSLAAPRPLGIPYMGSKRKYAHRLICKMLEHKPQAKYFYDLFGGGGAMSFAAQQMGFKVFYNEKQKSLVDFLRFIFERIENGEKGKFGLFPDDWYSFITREQFSELRVLDTPYAQFAKICYSFGNNQRCYLFNPELEKIKHLAHNVVVFQDKEALSQFNMLQDLKLQVSNKSTITQRRFDYLEYINSHKRCDLEQLERLERLEQLRLTNLDYRDVIINTPYEETIVYLDPPYRNTFTYIEGLCHKELDEFFIYLPYTAFMSEYSAPFKSIMEIETRSTLSPTSNVCKKVEKLYIQEKN
jgi:site-specific DNA-adenine methylase